MQDLMVQTIRVLALPKVACRDKAEETIRSVAETRSRRGQIQRTTRKLQVEPEENAPAQKPGL